MENIVKEAVHKIRNHEVELSLITKLVLVIDEAQDMDEDEFNLVKSLMELNEEMRVIAVGDDDQSIFEFRGASSKYLAQLSDLGNSITYELVENFRSKANLVNFSNQFIKQIPSRLKKNPIVAVHYENGRLRIVKYLNNNLTVPLVNEIISSKLYGSTCVLTKTNEEAVQITGLLLNENIPATLVQTNDGFSLLNLLEISFFLDLLALPDEVYVITAEVWQNAKLHFESRFRNSTKFEITKQIINDFELAHTGAKYKSDFEAFIRESRLEDFLQENSEVVYVSTIHKAKGREFDHVFLMLENFDATSPESKRQLYVAITRAKQQLSIHLNTAILDKFYVEELERVIDKSESPTPSLITWHLTHRDVWIDYFISRQHVINQLTSGDVLILNEEGGLSFGKYPVLKFSSQCIKQINDQKQRGFVLSAARVNFVVYWRKDGAAKEVKIVLPELCFERKVQ